MRHKVAGRRLSRTKEHRLAMRRNMVASLIQHETISTTIEKAKEVKAPGHCPAWKSQHRRLRGRPSGQNRHDNWKVVQ